jgi:hypothetical protein
MEGTTPDVVIIVKFGCPIQFNVSLLPKNLKIHSEIGELKLIIQWPYTVSFPNNSILFILEILNKHDIMLFLS